MQRNIFRFIGIRAAWLLTVPALASAVLLYDTPGFYSFAAELFLPALFCLFMVTWYAFVQPRDRIWCAIISSTITWFIAGACVRWFLNACEEMACILIIYFAPVAVGLAFIVTIVSFYDGIQGRRKHGKS